MKLIIFVLTLILCGCGNPYPNEMVLIEIGGKGEVDSITLIKDTIRVYRSNFIKDAAWYKMHPKDSFSITLDSTYIINYKGDEKDTDSFDIKIESHNGDIITGKSVKNVYNQ